MGRQCCGHPVQVSQLGGRPHICPWVGPHAASFGRQLWGLPCRLEYLSPQGVLPPQVYGAIASPLWLQLRGPSSWQATPSWTVYRLACHRLLTWLQVPSVMVIDAAWPGSDERPWGTAPAAGPVSRLGRPSASDPGVFFCCYLSLRRPTGAHARCVMLCVRYPGPLGPCSPVCTLGMLCCVCGVLGHLPPVHRCAHSVCCAVTYEFSSCFFAKFEIMHFQNRDIKLYAVVPLFSNYEENYAVAGAGAANKLSTTAAYASFTIPTAVRNRKSRKSPLFCTVGSKVKA